MPLEAKSFDEEIYEALRDKSAGAKSLMYVMLYWTHQLPKERRGFLERDGRPLTRTELARMASLEPPEAGAPLSFQELTAATFAELGELVQQDGRLLYLEPVRRQAEFRHRRAESSKRSQAKKQGRVLINTRNDANRVLINTQLTPDPPPEVSPPITPSSLPPPSHTPREGEVLINTHPPSPESLVGSEDRARALRAFDGWAKRDRGSEINELHGEHVPIFAMLGRLAQEPPIVRNGRPVPRQALVTEAVAELMRRGKPFKPRRGVPYACTTVESHIDEVMASGVTSGGARKAAPAVMHETFVRDP